MSKSDGTVFIKLGLPTIAPQRFGRTVQSSRRLGLIAAAPEMLELLKVCRETIGTIMEAGHFGDYWDLFNEMGRVIAMAEGDEK